MAGKTITRRTAIACFAAATGAVATAGVAASPAKAAEDAAARTKARYRETDHVRAFYRVNRYPCQGDKTC